MTPIPKTMSVVPYAGAADFVRRGDRGDMKVSPPLEVVRDVSAHPELPFPPLEGITETPILQPPDGIIVARPGYDRASRMIYAPALGLDSTVFDSYDKPRIVAEYHPPGDRRSRSNRRHSSSNSALLARSAWMMRRSSRRFGIATGGAKITRFIPVDIRQHLLYDSGCRRMVTLTIRDVNGGAFGW